jgi:hypothetical protein
VTTTPSGPRQRADEALIAQWILAARQYLGLPTQDEGDWLAVTRAGSSVQRQVPM